MRLTKSPHQGCSCHLLHGSCYCLYRGDICTKCRASRNTFECSQTSTNRCVAQCTRQPGTSQHQSASALTFLDTVTGRSLPTLWACSLDCFGQTSCTDLLGEMAMLLCFMADSSRAMPPQALGEDMEVPFISCRTCSVHWGTGAMAPPGADRTTPVAPSGVGPLLDHVYCWPCTL